MNGDAGRGWFERVKSEHVCDKSFLLNGSRAVSSDRVKTLSGNGGLPASQAQYFLLNLGGGG